ncbi:protein pangolin, isoforms A/H/I/S isoform X2 [Drosophila innubila]|uniref:protein pangolin, isoforms A/H/I/S isoform X2 n=1 Tax=Drosophila innubila TaxID=198719 RepID=UPI00148C9477|nr:protein pangolin, isoforms A/H/I/S isoform X2 [Drosophila innubila]
MPHTHTRHGSSGDDLGSTDEVKIFKDEGDREDEKISSENLLVEEKSSLIDLTESEEKGSKTVSRPDHSPVFNKLEPHTHTFNMGYLVSPYSYANGAPGGLPVTMANKIGLPPFFCHNGDPLTTPPPAHCGIPPYQLDPKAIGLTRPALYPFTASQYPYPMLSPDMSQVASWHTPSVYSASSFRSPYPSSLPINTTLSSDFPFRFSPSLLPSVHATPHHVLNSHPAIVTSSSKQECGIQDTTTNNRYSRNLDIKSSSNTQANDCKDSSNDKKKPHIKKPLNAFMLYMKEMRAKVVAECTLKESAAINQILGRRWHALGREEQAKYYELARRERQLHMQMYPDWSSRTNATRGKKRKRKPEASNDGGGNNMKKCRARFGLDQQNQWCKPCRRKKKCIRYMEALNGGSGNGMQEDMDMDDTGNLSQLSDDDDDDDDLGDMAASCGSGDETERERDRERVTHKMADNEDNESMSQSLSSPGCLSGLSSLQSPSTTTSLASPLNINMLTSPATPATALPTATANMLSLSVSAEQPISRAGSGSGSGSGSSSGSTCSIINTPNTSSTASPASASTTGSGIGIGIGLGTANERAMMLGTRFSYLGMGLINNPEQVFQHLNSVTDTITNTSTSNSSTNGFSSSTYSGSVNAAVSKVVTSPTPTTTPTTASKTTTTTTPLPASTLHRNPIGANPRDINNPLSINQLTKRREDHISLLDANPYVHPHAHPHPHPTHPHPHPHPHHSLFSSSSFSQHFQQQLSNHSIALGMGMGMGMGMGIESAVSHPTMDTPSLKRRNTSDPPTGAAGNAASTTNASETGAISVS